MIDPVEFVAVAGCGLGVGAAISQIWGSFNKSKNGDSPVTKDVCIVKHADMDRRFARMETSMETGFAKVDHNFDRVFDKLETMPTNASEVTRRKENL